MQMLWLSTNHFLDNFVLGAEFAHHANISGNAYRYWKHGIAAKFEGSRTVFLQKSSIPPKHTSALAHCTPLEGMVPSQAFCDFTGLAPSHLTQSNGSRLYEKLHIITVNGIKFVNLKRFYDDLGLAYHFHIYIEKCHFFAPTPLEKKIKLTDTLCVGYY